jgi:membrane-associated phospholipid phosphatase/tRNA A-37 threonylcarbamoyl transferase component Bud32
LSLGNVMSNVVETRPITPPGGRRRRPSGEGPPLPRDLSRSGRWWAWGMAAVLVFWFLVVFTAAGTQVDLLDITILRWIEGLRTPTLDELFVGFQAAGGETAILGLRWTALVPALLFQRYRHALVFVACILVSTWVVANLNDGFGRPRPVEVEILGTWTGFSHPSSVIVDVAVALLGFLYLLVPRGRSRGWAKVAIGVLLGLLAVDRLYLAVDHPTDIVLGLVIGIGLPLVAFRMLVPNDAFPITYQRQKGAHLDVGGARGEAMKRALVEQLGLDVVDVRPFGLDGSSGSTPLRITLADGTRLFGKLYAWTHLRADRSYKLMRTLLYGRLEDEATFSTVRRLVQYEDYLLRLFREAGLPSAEPMGFVEITPEREYLLVTEFLEGAKEIGDPDVVVDEDVIDDALRQVRRLWVEGLAHRDVKPANLLVRDGKLLVIDVAFAEVRPSPWRQAVDLANMLLCLALRTDAATVYERALHVFSPEEIGEAFAATRGLTIPSQLRARLRADGRDLIGDFRRLAPPTPPIRIQRWSLRRIGLMLFVATLVLLGLVLTLGAFQGAKLL